MYAILEVDMRMFALYVLALSGVTAGTAGDAVCNTAKATWKCTAKLPTVDSMNAALFSAQPADVGGTCALPCTADADCTTLATAANLTGLVKCKTYADGKYCDATAN